jgi:D-alanyl-D-alanine dipeptidase
MEQPAGMPPTYPRHIAPGIVECDEPLVDLATVSALWLRTPHPPDHVHLGIRLRLGVVDRIVAAQTLLPSHLRLLVADGYRPPDVEVAHVERHLSDAASHLTGGEADLTLCDRQGEELWLGSAMYHAGPQILAGRPSRGTLSPEARARRLLLGRALSTVGLVGCPVAWWHWSYGNLHWAEATGAGTACYSELGPAEPGGDA